MPGFMRDSSIERTPKTLWDLTSALAIVAILKEYRGSLHRLGKIRLSCQKL